MAGRRGARSVGAFLPTIGDDLTMTTGGKLIQAALRDPMSQVGWTPRAAGWYTRSVAAGAFGVLAVGVASEHSAPGEATATIYVHFRDEQLELAVADVAGSREQGYKTTTATTSIGYLMPAARWCEWNVSAENVDAIAAEMADAVRTYAEPHLRALVADPQLLLAAIASSPSYATSTGLARAVLLMRRTGRSLEASELLGRRASGLATRSDAAAEMERHTIAALGRTSPR